jgi:hypothetical protein
MGATMFEFPLLNFSAIFRTHSLAGSNHLVQKSFFIFSFFAMTEAGMMTPKIIVCTGHITSIFLKRNVKLGTISQTKMSQIQISDDIPSETKLYETKMSETQMSKMLKCPKPVLLYTCFT